jgi:hypothetical protein
MGWALERVALLNGVKEVRHPAPIFPNGHPHRRSLTLRLLHNETEQLVAARQDQSSNQRFTASALNLTKRPALWKGNPWFRRLLTCRLLQRA